MELVSLRTMKLPKINSRNDSGTERGTDEGGNKEGANKEGANKEGPAKKGAAKNGEL